MEPRLYVVSFRHWLRQSLQPSASVRIQDLLTGSILTGRNCQRQVRASPPVWACPSGMF